VRRFLAVLHVEGGQAWTGAGAPLVSRPAGSRRASAAHRAGRGATHDRPDRPVPDTPRRPARRRAMLKRTPPRAR